MKEGVKYFENVDALASERFEAKEQSYSLLRSEMKTY